MPDSVLRLPGMLSATADVDEAVRVIDLVLHDNRLIAARDLTLASVEGAHREPLSPKTKGAHSYLEVGALCLRLLQRRLRLI